MSATVFAIRLLVVFAGFAWRTAAGVNLAPWSGCPRIYYWDTYASCQGTYDYITDSSWEASDASPRVVTLVGDEYYCCDVSEYRTNDRGCDSWHGKGASSATCVYADNYCPTLTVDDADPGAALCLGNYAQNNNNAWTGDDPDCTLTWVKEYHAFAVHRLGVVVGNATAHTCHNPTPTLVSGWNKLLPSDEDVFYVTAKNMHRPYSGIITTLPLADSPQKVWVGRTPTSDALVILQLHSTDPQAAYAAVSNSMENTFRLRIVAPPGCPSHTTENLSFMIAYNGVYTADGGQMTEAGRTTVTVSDGGTFIPFTSPFPATPVVLTTIRENTGALQDFIHSRIVSVNATGFTVVLETEQPHTALNPSWSTDVNFFAINTNGLITGLFGRRKYFAYVSSPPETITADFQTFTYPTDYHPEYLDTALFLDVPHVFVASQAAVDMTPVESRIGSSTTADLSFALREDTCSLPLDNVHTDNVFGIFCLSAGGDKYYKPETTTTTTTTTTTSTTTATTTALTTSTITAIVTVSTTTPSTFDIVKFGSTSQTFVIATVSAIGGLVAVAVGVKVVLVMASAAGGTAAA